MKDIKVFEVQIHVLLLCILIHISIADPLEESIKCSFEDSYCLTKQAQAKLQAFVRGDPKLGIKKLDVLSLDPVKVNASGLYYDLWNTNITGFNNSVIDSLSVNTHFKIMRLSFHTNLVLRSDYKSGGFAFSMPAGGHGKAEILLNNLQMEIILIYDITKNAQGKDIMDIKKIFYGADAVDGVHYQFENLFNGDKAKSDIFHDVLNKNWRAAVTTYGGYFIIKIFEQIVENIKVYMRSQPLEEIALY